MKDAAVGLWWLAVALFAATQLAAAQPAAAQVALENVHVVPLNSEIVLYDHAVVTDGDRIVALMPMDEYVAPPGVLRVDAGGGYLIPGLVDTHVHLEEYLDARPDFGDAPVFLRHGITMVFNLRGFPQHLELRDRIARGELLAPTVYTSGEFVNEPRVNDPAEAAAEVAAQALAGYDMIKFREVVEHDVGVLTTTGVDADTFRAIWRAAGEHGLPIIGHAPHGLGLDTVLESPMVIAHMGELVMLEIFPRTPPGGLRVYLALLVILAVATLISLVWHLAVRRRPGASPAASLARSALLPLLFLSGALSMILMLLPGGVYFGNVILIATFALFLSIALLLGVLTLFEALRPSPEASPGLRAGLVVSGICAMLAGAIGLTQGLPIALRSTTTGLDHIAAQIAAAGNQVGTTLIIYDEVLGLRRPGGLSRIHPDAVDGLHPEYRARFVGARDFFSTATPWRERLSIDGLVVRYDDFARAVTAALHQAGVPLLAGTDAYGFVLVAPGRSLHAELESLVAAGLSPYEALRAATVEPARFLGREAEFGTIGAGKVADMVLLPANPLGDITAVSEPLGVMLRGRWLPRDTLDALVVELRSTP